MEATVKEERASEEGREGGREGKAEHHKMMRSEQPSSSQKNTIANA